jgi:transcriptional regulator with PAS, ATPase and Fis domain
VNCSALPANLIESQLFGHVKGAFTGATSANLGAFGAANGGTLFLDETGELPLELQPKLLRALESNEITSVGASHPREVDVRIVAATNRDLESLVESGEFRADLFYRLQVLELEVSPLRQRPGDICLLVPEILKSIGCKTPFDDSAIRMLQSHDWPGNVRELKNLLIRASIHCPDGVSAGDLAEHLVPKRRTLRAIRNPREQLYQDVSDELRRNGGNQKVTMERLRIPRTTFYRWLKSQKIRQPIDENEVGMR